MSTLRENLLAEAALVVLPPELEQLVADVEQVVASLPGNVDRRTGADLITMHLFPVSYRTLEAWPLPTRHVNGRAIVPTAKLFEVAFAKLIAAPVIMGAGGARLRSTLPDHHLGAVNAEAAVRL